MNYYRIYKDNWSVVQKYETLEEAQAVANSYGAGYEVELIGAVEPLSIQVRLQMDLDFGQKLIYTFVEDNRIQGINTTQSEQLLVEFRDILGFAQTGAITSIAVYLPGLPTNDVYTIERKEKYIAMINGYLNQF
tara:strand:+ start:372 stop:773 length:402 start_codon:yes stop_codon:yes gene_type:complete